MISRFALMLAISGSLVGMTVSPALAGTISSAQTTLNDKTTLALAHAQTVADKGIEYLRSKQLPDGGWHGEKEPPAFTALVLRALVGDAGFTADTDFIKKGYDRLLQYQVPEGGIYRDALATYQTAISINALAAAHKPEYQPNIDKAVDYLKSLQWGVRVVEGPKGEKVIDATSPWYGGWGYGRGGRPDLSNTQMVVEALTDAGVPQDDPAYTAAVTFVSRLQNNSETNDQPWATNDGGFIYSPGADSRGESAAGEYTGPDGRRMLRSYGSMTYAGLKSMIHAGLTKDDPRVKAAWDWITSNWTLRENPGMRLFDPEHPDSGLYYYQLTLALAMHAYAQPVFQIPDGQNIDWRLALIDNIAHLQQADGSWVGSKRWMEGNSVLVTSYMVQALHEAQDDLRRHPLAD